MKKLSFLFFFIPIVFTSAQNLDSLYNTFLAVKGVTQFNAQQDVSIQSEQIKCSFGIINQIKLNYDKYSPLQKKNINSLLQRPASDTSFVTPKGWFRIHYKKTGYDAPLYDLNELARAADSSYNYEVNILGYKAPPDDGTEGGDKRYDIYIQNLGTGNYGYTEQEKNTGKNTYTCFTVIDNDFGQGVNTHGIDGARVTVAHEFHHAIQLGNYGFFDQDIFFHEITSTAMEEFVFPDIDDYIYYIGTYFRNPQKSFSSTSIDAGYSRAIWNLFLRERFGVNIIKRIWELMPSERALKAMAYAINEKNSSFKVEFNTFGVWTYFTGGRSIPNKYFQESSKYPLISPMIITGSMKVNSEPISNNFFQMNDNLSGARDSLVMLVSNCDVEGGITSPIPILPFTYSLSTQPISGGRAVNNKYYSKLEPVSSILIESNVFTGIFALAEIDYVYPQPFSYSKNSQIFIPVYPGIDGSARLNIYSVSMNLVYSAQVRIDGSGKLLWNGLDQNNKKLGTSVYLYVTESGGQIKKGKIVIYND